MAIYTGVDGVVREIENVDIGYYGRAGHLAIMKAGIDGVNRDLLDVTSQIQGLEIDVSYINVYTVDSNGNWTEDNGNSLEIANKYGSVKVTSNSITVTCTTRYKVLDLTYYVYVVYKDGHKEMLSDLMDKVKSEKDFSLKVYGYEYFRNDGKYINVCMGVKVLENYVNNSASKTMTITNSDYGGSYGWLMAERDESGTTTSQIEFQKFTFDGKSFPITVANNLKQEEDE